MKKLSFLIQGIFLIGTLCAQPVSRVIDKPVKTANRITGIVPAYNFSGVKTCFDMNSGNGSPLPPRAASNAYTIYKIDASGNITQVAYKRQGIAAITDKMWEPGEVIKFGFNISGGSLTLIEKVKYYAKEWEQYANIKFEYVPNISNATIKIGFQPGGSYSLIGRDALVVTSNATTMNFGWLTAVDESQIRRVVLHEFGHALGFIHEHQSPAASIPWDKEKVYAYYALPPNNWNRAQVDANIFAKYSGTETNYSTYDRLSVMHYPVPAELTADGSSIPFNTDFSNTDKLYATLVYPFPPSPPPATGTLKTGDDCDRVDFRIEYNVVPSDKIEFQFSLGQLNGRQVSWWKQIGIPGPNNSETLIQIQNHSLIASENKPSAIIQLPASQINAQKGIRFWKAKMLGVHTLLNYQWSVLPALRGGCRVLLTWTKDSCL